jgi:hypothetical protein
VVIGEQQRLDMHRGLVAALGEEVANVLMEHLPPLGWADVARRSDIDHLGATLGLEMQSMESRMDAKMSRLETSVHREMSKQTRTFMLATLAAVFAAVCGSVGGLAGLVH